jgi:hypothetical protein
MPAGKSTPLTPAIPAGWTSGAVLSFSVIDYRAPSMINSLQSIMFFRPGRFPVSMRQSG